MRIAVVGAGGVGGYFGGRLQLAGNQVQYIARGAHLQALQTEGLNLTSNGQTQHLPVVDATDDLAALHAPELVVVAVKSWDTEDLARQVATSIPADTTVLSLQNGVVAREILGRHIPDRQLLGGAASSRPSSPSPGRSPTTASCNASSSVSSTAPTVTGCADWTPPCAVRASTA